jgi:ADP-ribose pyrophosphatase
MKDIETLDSKVVYQNKWLTLREDKILRASGKEGIYGVVEKPDFAIIIPIDKDHVYLVEQYRYTIGKRQIEFPQGAWEDNPDAPALKLAAGELREETGLRAGKMEYVGFQYLAYGFCNQGYHIFLASELSQGKQELDSEEEDLKVLKMPIEEFKNKIIAGEIQDASSCNAFGLATLKGFI